jgi:DNA repair ATPase RecN
VVALEERLNSSDAIYRLGAQTRTAYDREQRTSYQSTLEHARALEQRLLRAEHLVDQVPELIKSAVREEFRPSNAFGNLSDLLKQSHAEVDGRILNIEKRLVEHYQKTRKIVKKLRAEVRLVQSEPEDDGRLEAITRQIAEIKRRQHAMLEYINAIRVHSGQDLSAVNSQLDGLWGQLSVKRRDSPIRIPR